MTAGQTTGLPGLWRFALRRERVRLLVPVVSVAGLVLLMATSLVRLYPTATDRAGAALTLDNPGSTFLVGRIYHAHDYTWGVMIGHETLVLVAVAAALACVTTLVRHTRAEEETGRAELVLAGPVGRQSPLWSGVGVAALLDVAIGAATAVALVALREPAVDLEGALVYAAAVTSVGWVFTGVAAVSAQLVTTARAASGLAATVLAASFMLRGVADTTEAAGWLSWCSPLGWAQQTYPWDEDRWWPLGLSALTGTVLVGLAALLSARRDLGAGLRPPRPGRAVASSLLRSPVGLALRVNRVVVLGWTAGLVTFAAVYGPVLGEADDFLTQMPVLTDFVPRGTEAGGVRLFAAILVGLGAIVAVAPGVQVLTRACADEQAGRTAALLSGGATRQGWFAANVTVALGSAAVAVTGLSLVLGATARRLTGDERLLGDVVEGGLSRLSAVAVVVGVAAVLAGWAPRRVGLAWAFVAYCAVVFYFAEILDWPSWARWLSPFDHLLARPAEAGGDTTAQLVQWGLAALLVALGAVGYRRRAIR